MASPLISRPLAPKTSAAGLLAAALGLWLGAAGTAGPAWAEQPYLTITRADCQRLVRHVPAADVAYQPGVDVRGRPVAPADLGAAEPGAAPPLALPQAVVIPIEVDLFDRFGIPAGGVNFEADAFIGEVTVDLATGEAFFNGQPLQSEAEAELAARCQRILRSADEAK
ncbi:hypothetical protein [Pelagibius sp.]|uniref:hypothetical protein n=1 Tax=Pelagibius sp. TaxID=1931238 RepID=UPI002618A9B0|nr:hypothetical protein [Pelagibius sp.]